MKAKDMFEKLGYEKYFSKGIYWSDRIIYLGVRSKYNSITFFVGEKRLYIKSTKLVSDVTIELNFYYLQAITQQMKELGWIPLTPIEEKPNELIDTINQLLFNDSDLKLENRGYESKHNITGRGLVYVIDTRKTPIEVKIGDIIKFDDIVYTVRGIEKAGLGDWVNPIIGILVRPKENKL